jgi:hypothetical protein
MFLPPLPKRILRNCPVGSYCRVEGVSYGEGEVAPEINAFTRVTRVQGTAQKWFLTVDIYAYDNRGSTHWNDPVTRHLEHAFNSRDKCLERARAFRKQCGGLIADQPHGGFGVAKFIGYCRRHSQQPEPVLKAPESVSYPDLVAAFEQERECVK